MLQQAIALIIILFFILRLLDQKKKKEIKQNELILWLIFWLSAAIAILLIRKIDQLLSLLGFSLSGISFLVYLAVLALFYLVFRLRLGLAKIDRNLTELARQIALNNKDKN